MPPAATPEKGTPVRGPGGATLSPVGSSLRAYVKQHSVEPLLAEALKAACDANAQDPVLFIGEFMLKKRNKLPAPADDSASSEASDYASKSAFGIMKQRTLWLLFFLFGLLICANVMGGFEELLAEQLELAFFVPLLIGHGGNSGGQVVSTVIRALGSGALKLSDAPRTIFKEAVAGLSQSIVLATVMAPALNLGLGISQNVTAIVCITLPVLGCGANTLGATLPFLVTWLGKDPAVIVNPLMTTTVDSCGLLSYLFIATTYFTYVVNGTSSAKECRKVGFGCQPANEFTTACTGGGFRQCIPA